MFNTNVEITEIKKIVYHMVEKELYIFPPIFRIFQKFP